MPKTIAAAAQRLSKCGECRVQPFYGPHVIKSSKMEKFCREASTQSASHPASAFLALMLAACGKWQDFPVAEGAFSVMTPPGVNLECRNQKAANGMEVQACDGETAATALVVIAVKLPGEIDARRLEEAFANAKNIAAKNTKGEITASNDVELNGVKGKEFVLNSPRGEATSRIFVGNGYTVMA